MNKKTILIVDDTVTNIDILIELLKDYNIIDTTSGKDALLIAQNEKIDLVLLDIVMPEMNGYEVCRKLKQNQKIKDIPIIFITAKTDEDSIEEAYESGGIDYITKPFKPKELLTKVKTHLELHRKTLNLKDLVEKSRYLKILYIEDDKINQEQTLKIFKNFFEYVDTAVDGKDGLKQYVTKDKNFYDIVISDINMPKLNGIELSKKILNINKKQKIVLMSGFYDLDNLAEIISLGISSYIQKPISLNIFIDTLSKIVNQIEDENTKEKEFTEIEKLNNELDSLVNSFDTYVIASRTNLKGIITYASKAYQAISGYTEKELVGKPHNIVRHPDMPASAFKAMWETIQAGKLWRGEVKNLKKNKDHYWVYAYIAPYYNAKSEHIGYSAIRLDITSQKKVQELNQNINNLLNNAGQGFLSFDKNMIIDESFSKECLTIFNEDINKKNISTVLFENDPIKKDLFEDGIGKILSNNSTMAKEILLSLLPTEHNINNLSVSIEYKLLLDDKFMLILTDITHRKELEEKLQKQNKIHKMIVEIVSNKNDFLDLKNDFNYFLANPPKDIEIFLRDLHTFKGLFAQKEMISTQYSIHELETILKNSKKEDIIDKFLQYNLQYYFKKDLEIIEKILGKNFINLKYSINIDMDNLNNFENKLKESNVEPQLLVEFNKLKDKTLFSMLNTYVLAVKKMAKRLEKDIYPLEIIGDSELKVPYNYKFFINSLFHLFNNCIDHGIEDAETRLENNKCETGTIKCSFKEIEGNIELSISDDGAGININKLSKSALNNNIISKQILETKTEEEKLFLIFENNISTKKNLSITSGRGIGMGAIYRQLKLLKGDVKIINKLGKGVKFIFTIPL